MKLRRMMPALSLAWGAFRLYRRSRAAVKARTRVAQKTLRSRLARMT